MLESPRESEAAAAARAALAAKAACRVEVREGLGFLPFIGAVDSEADGGLATEDLRGSFCREGRLDV